ncbi:MAG: DUF1579 family protein [Planctomycetota bacterium]
MPGLLFAIGFGASIGLLTTGNQEERAGDDPSPAMLAQMELAKPGPEHKRLAALAGEWSVGMIPAGASEAVRTGSAVIKSIMDERFIDISITLGEEAAASSLRYTVGFDRRHDEYTVTLVDSSGTYPVYSRGKDEGDRIRTRGTDDDPYMTSLGLEKEFIFDLILGDEQADIVLHFVDTRVEERPALEMYRYRLNRTIK